MNIFEKGNGSNVCAIFSHPDDAELLCYGTLAKFKEEGFNITLLVVTGGVHGTSVEEEKIRNLEKIRLLETKEALKDITTDIRFLGLQDGAVQFNNESVSIIEKTINSLRPSKVLTHFTDQSGIDHQDHSMVSKIVKNICFRKTFVNLLLCAEPLKQGTTFKPNLFINIGKFFTQKIIAISKHRSQMGRIYMTEAFHNSRSLIWQNHLGLQNEEYVESFMIEKAIS